MGGSRGHTTSLPKPALLLLPTCSCREGVYMRWVEDALDAVQNQLDPWLYDHIVLDLPNMDDCDFAAWAEMGKFHANPASHCAG